MSAPDTIAADFQRALALHQQGNLDAAEPIYRAILGHQADHFGALHLSGLIHLQRGQLDEAVRRIDQAIAVNAAAPEAHSNLAHALQGLRRFEEALASCDRALALRPDHPEALNNRGNALLDLGRPVEALAAYDRALAARAAFPQAYSNRGNALRALGRLPEALESYRRALQAWPDFPAALDNCGRVLRDLKRYDEAAPVFARLLAVAPTQPYAPGLLFDTRLNCCEWTGYEAMSAALTAAIERGERADAPQSFVSHSQSPAAQLKCAELYCAAEWPEAAAPLPVHGGNKRIHVCYLSADLHEHATAHLMAGLFEAHDRTRFEVTAVSFGPDDGSPMRARLKQAFERFVDVRGRSDREVADMLRDLGVDIAVDLKGYTAANRAGILARRAAPLQVNYLGFPCSMGAPFIDYMIADRHVVPSRHEAAYREKIVRLPDSYQVNDDKRQIDEHTPACDELGLPPTGFVFCSFNNSFKIRPQIFDVWMRLLHDIEGSVLWLLDDNTAATANLRREA
jgi:protein O-GlcNAc transferase